MTDVPISIPGDSDIPTVGNEVVQVPGERLRYRVLPSKVRPGGDPFYLVDLEENEGNGWCNCRDFEIRHGPKIAAGEPGEHKCKHIIQVEAWLRMQEESTE